MSHTPGPWAYRPNGDDDWGVVRAADGGYICQARDPARFGDALGPHRVIGTDPWEGNARLIAAAPDLLALVEGAEIPMAGSDSKWDREWAVRARAVLARVKGEG